VQALELAPCHFALGTALAAFEPLVHLHSLGIVHCDIKPDNLFVLKSGSGDLVLKLGDLGMSQLEAYLAGTRVTMRTARTRWALHAALVCAGMVTSCIEGGLLAAMSVS
jgi:serine/threonine protein kinase